MGNKDSLIATYTAIAISLLITAVICFLLSTGVNIKPFSTIMIGILLILDFILIGLLATQAEFNQEAIYGVSLFMGLSALLLLIWLDSASIITAGLAVGYALVFLLGDFVLMQTAAPKLSTAQPRPQPAYRPSTTYIVENNSGASKQ
ncbi:MAG: hypothetical protein AABX51_07440, partial [Nanoarchaeota archaeon]